MKGAPSPESSSAFMVSSAPPVSGEAAEVENLQRLRAMLDQADGLWREGRLITARKLEEQVVAGRSRLLGRAHPDTLKAIGKLAVTMAAQGELAGARHLQEEVADGMRRLYGETGRDTLRALNNLAGTVAAQGDPARACEMLQSVIAAVGSEYGEGDADGVMAMGNLAAILWQDGEREGAYELQRQVVELCRRIDGNDDPATLAAIAVLEMMERQSLDGS